MKRYMNGNRNNTLHQCIGGFLFVLLLLSACKTVNRVPESEVGPKKEPVPWMGELTDLLAYHNGESDLFLKTTLVREFVAARAEFGGDSIQYEKITPYWYRTSATAMYDKFQAQKATANPVTTATMLRRMYIDLGYTAFDYHVGVPGQIDHDFNLVRIPYAGKTRLIIQDATFNQTYTDSLGVPWDLFDLIEELKKNELSNIRRRFSEFNPVPGVLVKSNEIITSPWIVAEGWKMEKSANERYPYRFISPRDFERYKEVNKHRYGPLLQANGYPEEMLYLIFFPIAVYGDYDFRELEEKIRIATGDKQQEVDLPDSLLQNFDPTEPE